MKQQSTKNFIKTLWFSGKKDLLLGLPWLPIYSIAEIIIALSLTTLLQLVFISTPRIQVGELVPGQLKNIISFSQTLDRRDLIFIIPIIIITASLIKLISAFMSSYFTERAGHKVAHTLREQMLKGFISSPGNKLDQKNPDYIANQLMQDTTLLQGAVSKGTISAVRDFLVLIGIIITMLFISWQTFLIGICIFVPLGIIFKKIAKKINYYTRESQKHQIGISARFISSHNGLLTINALRSHQREESDFNDLNFNNYSFMKKSIFVRTFFSPSIEFLAALILGIIFVLKLNYTEVFKSTIYASMLILLIFSFRYIKNIAGAITFFSEIRVVFQRVYLFLDDFKTSTNNILTPISYNSANSIEANQVSYTTEDHQNIIINCSLKIAKGSKIAFIGESGAGKTTMLRMLAGLLIPSKGSISIEPEFLYASQSPYLFKGTIKENIIYSEQKIPDHIADEKVKDLIIALSLAYSESGSKIMMDKNLGFLGEGLSGGEKARVALARTLFVSPKLILLDEPTANLDAESAQLFWKAVRSWKNKDSEHTIVTVCHVLQEIKDFDLCYVFANGKIINKCSPKELF
ncbi:ABC transporter ATP-binding protein [Spirobacillus cienkowskii]|uniref:ABC transporter ATP-binding protein n=1 Tax=Spirobacillus cienkowskii TaxID=495820 RepID=UPI0030CE5274